MSLFERLTIAALLWSLPFAFLLVYAVYIEEMNLRAELTKKHILAIALAISGVVLVELFEYKRCDSTCYSKAYALPKFCFIGWCFYYLIADLSDALDKQFTQFVYFTLKHYFTAATSGLILLVCLNLYY